MILISSAQAQDIPDEPGVYGFFPLLASRQRVGIIGRPPFCDAVLLNAKANLQRRLRRIQDIFVSKELTGIVKQNGKGRDLAQAYSVSLKNYDIDDVLAVIETVEGPTIPGLVDTLERASLMLGPIYAGMTRMQTLAQRYSQHRADYHAQTKRDVFAARLIQSGLQWDDLMFGCVPVTLGSSDIRTVERIMHMLLKAPLSNN